MILFSLTLLHFSGHKPFLKNNSIITKNGVATRRFNENDIDAVIKFKDEPQINGDVILIFILKTINTFLENIKKELNGILKTFRCKYNGKKTNPQIYYTYKDEKI